MDLLPSRFKATLAAHPTAQDSSFEHEDYADHGARQAARSGRSHAHRAQPLRQLHDWLERYRQVWDARFEELDGLIEELKEEEKSHGRKKRK
ncbi:MAG: hypothetical protein ACREMD_09265 [Gemmatimonadota bacterium]